MNRSIVWLVRLLLLVILSSMAVLAVNADELPTAKEMRSRTQAYRKIRIEVQVPVILKLAQKAIDEGAVYGYETNFDVRDFDQEAIHLASEKLRSRGYVCETFYSYISGSQLMSISWRHK